MTGRSCGSELISFSSTARFARRYRLRKSGARFCSMKEPPAMFGHPASAAEVKQKGNGTVALASDSMYSNAASIALKAVKRVMVSYVEPESGRDPDPEAKRLYWPNPDSSSNSKPTQWMTPAGSCKQRPVHLS